MKQQIQVEHCILLGCGVTGKKTVVSTCYTDVSKLKPNFVTHTLEAMMSDIKYTWNSALQLVEFNGLRDRASQGGNHEDCGFLDVTPCRLV
jgi:hypothetical protein